MNTAPNQPLNRLQVDEMRKALHRVRQLTGSTIQTPENEVQIEADLKSITKTFLDHAQEFIAFYYIIAGEYEVILNAFSIINRRLAANSAPAPNEIDSVISR